MAQDFNRLRLHPLRADQYRQVAEWEFGPQPQNTDWAKYEAEMNAPQWEHFGLYDGAQFVGCISLERDRGTVAFHVVTARRKVHPRALANILLAKAGKLFACGHVALVTRIPVENRAAARLAIRCGMREWGHTSAEWVREPIRYFILTKSRYDAQRTNRQGDG